MRGSLMLSLCADTSPGDCRSQWRGDERQGAVQVNAMSASVRDWNAGMTVVARQVGGQRRVEVHPSANSTPQAGPQGYTPAHVRRHPDPLSPL
jgi:hypothetical protein